MNLLVTLNSSYIFPLCVLMRSIKVTNPNTKFDVYVAHSSLTEADFKKIDENINDNITIHSVVVDEGVFDQAPKLSRISKETYYRLLLADILPECVDRVLYIDPDTVVINSLEEFYNMDLNEKVIAATPHTYGVVECANFLRLGLKQDGHYVNAGVLLIDVNAWRKTITTAEIIDFVSKNIKKLKLSDQDAINMIFEGKILFADERKYNLDEKTYTHYYIRKKIDMNWVEKNTVIVHFNGSQKPWSVQKYRGRLGGYFERFR